MFWREIPPKEDKASASGVQHWQDLPCPASRAVSAWLPDLRSASASEVRSAYRQSARRLHPDVVPPEERSAAGARMAALNAAYRAWMEQQ